MANRMSVVAVVGLASISIGGCETVEGVGDGYGSHNRIDHSDIGEVLDGWHEDAATGNLEHYFDAMTEGSVFLGTDASERWDRDSFRVFAAPHFADGHGWSYRPRDRHIRTNAYGDVAWVDEILDHDSYGELRGTAVLRRNGEEWRIAHYSLSFLVPNAVVGEVVEVIEGSRP